MSEENAELSPVEYAILELTNDPDELRESGADGASRAAVLTTKSAYIWGAAIVSLLEQNEQLDEQAFLNALRDACGQEEGEIKRYFDRVNDFRPPFPDEIFKSVLKRLAEHLDLQIDPQKEAERARFAYRSLVDKNFVEDPPEILLYGIQVAVVGLVPVGFTLTTAKGRIEKIKYRSILLDVDYERAKGKKTYHIDFRLPKFLNAFKTGFVEGFKRVLAKTNDGNEKDTQDSQAE